MKTKIAFIVATLCVFSFSSASFAKSAKQDEQFNLIHIADLETMLSRDSKPAVLDANNDETREKYGIIPGAIKLDSSKKYELGKLPKDHTTQLVFYCANTQCMSSHQAAHRAVKAGYTHVSVLSDGIMGWKNAGKPTDTYKKSGS